MGTQSGTFRDLDVNITARSLNIIGAGPSATTLDCENKGTLAIRDEKNFHIGARVTVLSSFALARAFTIINATISLSDFTITRGRAFRSGPSFTTSDTAGGGIFVATSTLSLLRVNLVDCTSPAASSNGPAGCLASGSSNVNITDCDFLRYAPIPSLFYSFLSDVLLSLLSLCCVPTTVGIFLRLSLTIKIDLAPQLPCRYRWSDLL